jgi:long-chain acyl-CoA synthetase
MFHYFMAVAKRCGADILDGKPGVILGDRLLYALGNLLIYGPLRNVLGMSRIRVAYTAGAAIGPDLFRFYRSIGVNLKQLYGATETCAATSACSPIARSSSTASASRRPASRSRSPTTARCWCAARCCSRSTTSAPTPRPRRSTPRAGSMTGDAGFFDEDGHLKIIDRAKDVGKLANGAMFAPNYIENKLKFFPHIKEAVCFGHDRDMVCAFINIDMGAVGNWAERRGMPIPATPTWPQAGGLELIRECVEQVNADLSHDAMVAETQIHRFLVLHKELDPDDDELTRTRKVRRGFIAEKYGVLIDALYSGKTSQFIETQVKFEDGRTGKVSADLSIASQDLRPVMKKAA